MVFAVRALKVLAISMRVLAISLAVVVDALLLVFAIFFIAGSGSIGALFVTIACGALVVLNLRLFFPWPLHWSQVAGARPAAEVMSVIAVIVGSTGIGISAAGWSAAIEWRNQLVLVLVAGIVNLLASRLLAAEHSKTKLD
ncbi:MAG: hypothetical protein ABJC13_05215 [Acidobacteriota bacterium]